MMTVYGKYTWTQQKTIKLTHTDISDKHWHKRKKRSFDARGSRKMHICTQTIPETRLTRCYVPYNTVPPLICEDSESILGANWATETENSVISRDWRSDDILTKFLWPHPLILHTTKQFTSENGSVCCRSGYNGPAFILNRGNEV